MLETFTLDYMSSCTMGGKATLQPQLQPQPQKHWQNARQWIGLLYPGQSKGSDNSALDIIRVRPFCVLFVGMTAQSSSLSAAIKARSLGLV